MPRNKKNKSIWAQMQEDQINQMVLFAVEQLSGKPNDFDANILYLDIQIRVQAILKRLGQDTWGVSGANAQKISSLQKKINNSSHITHRLAQQSEATRLHRFFHGHHCQQKYNYVFIFSNGSQLVIKHPHNASKMRKYRYAFETTIGELDCKRMEQEEDKRYAKKR